MIGSAGVVKSSFVQQLALDWAQLRKWHKIFAFVFHFRCDDKLSKDVIMINHNGIQYTYYAYNVEVEEPD